MKISFTDMVGLKRVEFGFDEIPDGLNKNMLEILFRNFKKALKDSNE